MISAARRLAPALCVLSLWLACSPTPAPAPAWGCRRATVTGHTARGRGDGPLRSCSLVTTTRRRLRPLAARCRRVPDACGLPISDALIECHHVAHALRWQQ